MEQESIKTTENEIARTKKENKISAFIERFFHIKEKNSTIKNEIISGIGMSFITMCFFVINCKILGNAFSVTYYSAYLISTLIAFIGTLLLAIFCNVPFTQTSGLTISTMMTYTISANAGLTYANVLAINFIASLIYVALIFSPARKKIIKAIPTSVRKALPVALGAMIMIISLNQSGILNIDGNDVFKAFSFSSLSEFSTVSGTQYMAGFVAAIIAVLLFFALKFRDYKHPAIVSFLISTVAFFLIALLSEGSSTVYALNRLWFVGSEDAYNILRAVQETQWLQVFTSGLDFSAYTEAGGNIFLIFVKVILLFLCMSIFESDGMVQAADITGNGFLGDDEKTLTKIFQFNAIACVISPLLGGGPVSVGKASAISTSDGGRTGLSSLICSIEFLICSFTWLFFCLFATWTDSAVEWYYGHYGQCVDYYVTAQFSIAFAVTFAVGFTMLKSIKTCDFDSAEHAISFGVTVICSIFSMNLVTGVAFGTIALCLLKLLTFNPNEIKNIGIQTLVSTAIFILYLIIVFI